MMLYCQLVSCTGAMGPSRGNSALKMAVHEHMVTYDLKDDDRPCSAGSTFDVQRTEFDRKGWMWSRS